jgi:hypothetical protein
VTRLVALLCLSTLVFAATAYLLVSNLERWSFGHCGNNATVLCGVSGMVTGYWWLLAIPGIAALTYLGSRWWR